MSPKLGPHVTIVRYEIPTTEPVKAIDGEVYPLSYSHEMFGNNKHFWLNVRCEAAYALRKQMGLSEEPLIPFHLTVGVMPGTQLDAPY